jgi:anti-sigma factor ChrR (cupin superfamily)
MTKKATWPNEKMPANVHNESDVSHKDGQNRHDPIANADNDCHVL